jgi:hypothetical protein
MGAALQPPCSEVVGMTGLPRAKDETRPQDAFAVMVLGGIESLTHKLRRGDPFSERGLNDMILLQRRLRAFSDALDARMPVTEDE